MAGIVQTARLNVRQGPGPEYAAVRELRQGDRVIATGRNQDATWVKIDSCDFCWVNAVLVGLNTVQIASLPVQYRGQGQWSPAGAPTGVWVRPAERLHIRGCPSMQCAQLTNPDSLQTDDQVEVVGRIPNGDWLQVNVAGRSGWINASYVTFVTGSLASVPVQGS